MKRPKTFVEHSVDMSFRLDGIASILEAIDQRTLSVDGPIDFEDFRREIRKEEARAIYVLAKGERGKELSAALRLHGEARQKIRAASPSRVVRPSKEAKRKSRAARVAGHGRPARKPKGPTCP